MIQYENRTRTNQNGNSNLQPNARRKLHPTRHVCNNRSAKPKHKHDDQHTRTTTREQKARDNNMKATKQLTINIGNYESIRLGVEDADNYEECNRVILTEIKRLNLEVSDKIKQCLGLEAQE